MTHQDYNTFADSCLAEIQDRQAIFREQFDIDGYQDWFYNQSTGLLTFSTGSNQINFRYQAIGSYSEKSGTWKWSWDNETTIDSVKFEMAGVYEFGEKQGFEKLTTGCFESDEDEAWEFAAISAKLIGGIGLYRPVNDHQLQLFFVVKELIDNERAEAIKNKFIECPNHEYRRIAFVCQHLDRENKVGFHEAFETFEDMPLDDEDDFQAWCDICEEVRQREGEWNDQSMAFAKIKLVCEKCYFEMKSLNNPAD